MEKFEPGRIIWAVIEDPNGFAKPSPRPAMVAQLVTATDADDLIPVIVGSTKVFEPLPDDQVLIHSDFQRNPTTKLSRPTVLVCSWTSSVKYRDVQQKGGFIPGKKAFQIIQKALSLRDPADD